MLREIAPASTHHGVPPKERDLDQRFAVLRDAVFALASPAAHGDGIARKAVYTRADATAIIACVAGIATRS